MKYLIYLFTVFSLLGCPPPPASQFQDYYIQVPAAVDAAVNLAAASISIDNCLVVGGQMWGQVSFGNNISINLPLSPVNRLHNGWGIFLEKFDQNNQPLFAKLIGSVSSSNRNPRISVNIKDIALDDACNIYACGSFEGDLQLTPNGFLNTLTGDGNLDGFYAKFDPSGTLIWIRKIGGSGFQRIESIKLEGKDIYIAGNFSLATNFITQQLPAPQDLNGFYCRYQQVDGLPGVNGWEQIIKVYNPVGSEEITIEDMDVNRDSVLLAGNITGTYIFSGITAVAQGNNGFFAKASKDGTIRTVKQIEGLNNNSAPWLQSAFMKVNGGIVCSGSYTGKVDFETGPGLSVYNSQAGSPDLFIADYNNTGRSRWVNVYGSTDVEQFCRVEKDYRHRIIAFGEYNGIVNFGNRTLGTGSPVGGAFILKLNPLGFPLWVANAQSNSGSVGISKCFAASINRDRFIAGLYTGAGQMRLGFTGIHYRPNTNKWTYLTFYGN